MADRIVGQTKYLSLVERDGWSFVARGAGIGVITVVAVTADRKLLFVEQLRRAIGRTVIELPAGLAGDEPGSENEALATAAQRELIEETGYRADSMEAIAECPTSPGISDESVTFFLARGLTKISAGGGTENENIVVHEIPWNEVTTWLRTRELGGTPVSSTAYAGLFFAARVLGLPG